MPSVSPDRKMARSPVRRKWNDEDIQDADAFIKEDYHYEEAPVALVPNVEKR
jgi:hypothetical protein